jgi:hypothetical protein
MAEQFLDSPYILGKDPMVCRACGIGLLTLYQIITVKREAFPLPDTV